MRRPINPMSGMVLCVVALVWGGVSAVGQALPGGVGPTFSVDFQGPTAGGTPGAGFGLLDGFGFSPIDEGSILTTAPPGPPGPNPPLPGPLPTPGIVIGSFAGAPGAIPGGLGLFPGAAAPAPLELDALSYGHDYLIFPPIDNGVPGILNGFPAPDVPAQLVFSVDEFAFGIFGSPAAPNVSSEAALGGPASEAAADVFAYLGPVIPTAPGPVIGNTDIMDGDGLVGGFIGAFGGPGTGLIEPNGPLIGSTPGAIYDVGDNLDALDMDTHFDALFGRVYFSLDSSFPDPLEPPVANTGTALANMFVGGDVLVTIPGGPGPIIYAPAFTLGLDLIAGPDSDDLDALALYDTGAVGEFEPGIDFILFSVRRGSAIIGAPDSFFGAPIEPGDILSLPPGPGLFPSIFIPAEALGLATFRSGGVGQFGADDLDALDVLAIPTPSSLTLMGLTLLALMRRANRQK